MLWSSSGSLGGSSSEGNQKKGGKVLMLHDEPLSTSEW